ncbi:MAG: phosphopentomutase [Clostridia bacterium]|nr:phosphopentomutase [Clostridia bacterium]
MKIPKKRVFIIVLDSLGIGYEPDADMFGDVGANTLQSISKSDKFNIPILKELGIGSIDGIDFLDSENAPRAAVARLREVSMGKDTTVGHWELMGLVSASPLPIYPDGFPKEVTDRFTELTGRGILCNKPYSGTEVIKDFGDEHIRTGKLIVYTSADSVFQIAAHESVIPVEELYKYCEIARAMLTGEHSVGRVIARPFHTDENGAFKRSDKRHDYSLVPPRATAMTAALNAGLDVIAVGKINDIFAGDGVTRSVYTKGNKDGIDTTLRIMDEDFHGMCFTNLVDFDMLYGHRQDPDGYAEALSYFDKRLPEILQKLREDDLLIITADHGCDPADESTDHTREYVPAIICGHGVKPVNLGTLLGFGTVGQLVADTLGVQFTAEAAESVVERI